MGAQIDFEVSSRWRRAGCYQAIDLIGIDAMGIRDGETADVPLAEIKSAVRKLAAADTRVTTEGDCALYSVFSPEAPQDRRLSVSCRRLGDALACRYEGEFSELPVVFQTNAHIGENVKGVF